MYSFGSILDKPDSYGIDYLITLPEEGEEVTLEITTDAAVEVALHVFTPPNISPVVDQYLTVKRGEKIQIDIPKELIEEVDIGTLNTIRLQSNYPISVNVINQGSCAGLLTLPITELGTEYYIITWDPEIANTGKSLFMMSAAAQNTKILIELPMGISFVYHGNMYNSENPFILELASYESFRISHLKSLNGVHIVSDKYIAVSSGNTNIVIGSADSSLIKDTVHMQLPPVSTWGRTFVAVPPPRDQNGGILTLMASEDATNIITQTSTIIRHRGEFYNLNMESGEIIGIRSNKAVLAVYFTKSGTEEDDPKYSPSALLLPPVEQYLTKYVFSTLDITGRSSDVYLSVIVHSDMINDILLDDELVTSLEWKVVDTISNLRATHISITSGDHTITTTNSSITLGALVFGNVNDYCSYAFPAGMGLKRLQLVSIHNQPCKQNRYY